MLETKTWITKAKNRKLISENDFTSMAQKRDFVKSVGKTSTPLSLTFNCQPFVILSGVEIWIKVDFSHKLGNYNIKTIGNTKTND